ncbi:NmrA family NAD(P)-binding protein [Saccharothrix syringae]|uniref:NmrA family transcriptional regulator n=1 Tax=Saccharothrix syringae TaxID=103733 RepID=A0A5Q0H248_SACSY|nr:NAD(P)H-binding protein [Saccharothrix syringae]QFZ19752.1 NmrA family transcriptional regulator [Saccharothrix syringae]
MIVVTTPTGSTGSQVVQHLLDLGAPVRVVVRDPGRLPAQVRERVDVVPGSHGDAEVVEKAFAGADAVFWVAPPNYRAPSLEAVYSDFARPACEAFAQQGVGRVVGLSALGRGSALAGRAGLVTASLAMDDLIAGTGVAYRSLAAPGFMDNALRQVGSIRDRGVFTSPLSPDRALPTCATRDIAAVAATLLLDGSWDGQDSVPLLGPEDLSGNDMAAIIAEVLGRPVRYEQVTGEEYLAGLVGHGMSEVVARGMLDMFVAKDNGLDEARLDASRSLTPTTFRRWCEDVLAAA